MVSAAQDTTTFITELLGEVPEDKHALLWTLQNKRSSWVSLEHGTDAVAEEAAKLSADGMDCYIGASVARSPGGHATRIKSEESAGLMGLWADIDIADPDVHKKWNLPPDETSAMDVLTRAGVAPTLVVHSGHGLQAWWLFHEFWEFDTDTERLTAAGLAQRWNTTLRVRAAETGWTIDSTFDLARVMRVPGTLNRKGTPVVPVQLLRADGPRWNPSDFDTFLVDDKFLLSKGISPAQSYVPDKLELTEAAEPPFEKFTVLMQNDDGSFERTWKRARKDFTDQSASSYDLSIATQCAQMGFSDQEIANTIFAWRRMHKEDTQKALRQDYMARTISKARTVADRDRLSDEVEERMDGLREAKQTGDPEAIKETRQGAWEPLIAQLDSLMVLHLFRYNTEPPTFDLETVLGTVNLGPIEAITNWYRFYNSILGTLGHSIPQAKQAAWHQFCSKLPELWEDQDVGLEATDRGQMQSWLTQYISQRPPAGDADEAALSEYPFIDDAGRTCLFLNGFKRWLFIQHQEKIGPKVLATRLKQFGADYGSINVTIDGKRTSRSIWRLPKDVKL